MENKNKSIQEHNEIQELFKLNDFLYELQKSDFYVPRSKYKNELLKYKQTIDFFSVLNKSDLLQDFCKKNRLSIEGIRSLIDLYESIDDKIDKHNDEYIKKSLIDEREYLDNILKEIDPDIKLDKDQREVVLTDEDNVLVIAGAGAGKTTTVAAKAKYLVEKKNIPANEILIVSFTNKAVGELRDKIIKELKLDCIISTFHSIGNAILKTQSIETPKIVTEGYLYNILLEYFKNSVFTNQILTKKLVLFFSTYFNEVSDGSDIGKFLNELSRTNYTTLKSDVDDFKQTIIDSRTKRKVTIQNEIVRSYQEVQIANYLYLNGIDYTYEPVYPYNIKMANKPYTPDFVIKQGEHVAYLEHFGISQDGDNDMFTQEQLEKYRNAVNDKVKLHRNHKTELIYTFSQYNDGRTLLQHLDEELRSKGFVLRKRDEKEVLNKIIETEESKYVSKLITLVCRFINLFKINGYGVEKFDSFKNSTQNVRNRLFLDICKECYLEYERYLKEDNAIDFQDMINKSAAMLQEMADKKEKLRFKYVIVDEYQDISKQRFDLVGALKKVCDAKVMAVGDDWQAIYAFSGSDVGLFLDFEKKMGYAKMLKIENTYRNSQEIIDIAGQFIQKNNFQIKKTLRSPKHIEDPIIIYTYDSSRKGQNTNNKSGGNYNQALTVQQCLDDIIEYAKKDNKKIGNVLILGRYNFDGRELENSGLFEFKNTSKQGRIKSLKYPEMDITFMTAHASKGLGYDNVIIINCQNARFGFPSKIQDDPVLQHVLIKDSSYEYAEERRLFYVAMTRTKNRVYCVAPQKFPSEFLVEIKNDYDKILKHGEWDEETVRPNYTRACPICGYPLQFKYKPSFGLRLHICTNEPEICGFMTNEIKAGKMQIMKCDQCQDGYLIIKPGKNGYFLGCTNYKSDGSGCNKVISKEKYFEIYSLTPDKPIVSVNRRRKTNDSDKNFEITISKDAVYNKKDFDLNNNADFYYVTKIIISCVEHVSQKIYFGTNKIIDILSGIEPENKTKINLKNLPEFGMTAQYERLQIKAIMMALTKYNLLLQTKEKYPVIHPTNEGKEYFSNYDKGLVKKVIAAYKKIYINLQNKKEKNEKNDEQLSGTIIKDQKV